MQFLQVIFYNYMIHFHWSYSMETLLETACGFGRLLDM